jgi:hypothetical protein
MPTARRPLRQFFHVVSYDAFGGEKGERKEGGKFVFDEVYVNTIAKGCKNNLHDTSAN